MDRERVVIELGAEGSSTYGLWDRIEAPPIVRRCDGNLFGNQPSDIGPHAPSRDKKVTQPDLLEYNLSLPDR